MGKTRKTKPFRIRKPMDPERARLLRRMFGKVLVLAIVIGLGAAGFARGRHYVEQDVALPSAPLIVVVKNQPRWMTDFLVQQIAAAARPVVPHSAFREQILEGTSNSLRTNP